MRTTKITYVVSTYNDTPINTIEYKGESRLQADLTLMQAYREGKHGAMVQHTLIENLEFNYRDEKSEIIKNF